MAIDIVKLVVLGDKGQEEDDEDDDNGTHHKESTALIVGLIMAGVIVMCVILAFAIFGFKTMWVHLFT